MRPFRRLKIGKNTAFPAVDDKHENFAPSTLVSLNRPLRTNALRLIQKKTAPTIPREPSLWTGAGEGS